MSDLVRVISASSQAEAKMYEEILRKNNIPCILIQDNPSGMLSARSGGAEVPISIIDIQVKPEDLERAKGLLPEKPFEPPMSSRRKVGAGAFVLYFLISAVIIYILIKIF